MAMVVTQSFQRAILVEALGLLTTLRLRLFRNNVTPTPQSVTSLFLEPAGPWYAPFSLEAWGPPFTPLGACAEVDEIIRTWTIGGSFVNESIYGYFVTTPGGLLCFAEPDPSAPVPMNAAGLSYRVLPRYQSGILVPC